MFKGHLLVTKLWMQKKEVTFCQKLPGNLSLAVKILEQHHTTSLAMTYFVYVTGLTPRLEKLLPHVTSHLPEKKTPSLHLSSPHRASASAFLDSSCPTCGAMVQVVTGVNDEERRDESQTLRKWGETGRSKDPKRR